MDNNPEQIQKPQQPEAEHSTEAEKWWRKRWIKWAGVAFGLVVIVLVIVLIMSGGSEKSSNQQANFSDNESSDSLDSLAIKAGKQLTNNQCDGEGVPYKLSVSPMKPEDFSIIVPYGLMIGGHVTPIDHQYFSPADNQSQPDAYEVFAMADSTIVDITSRPRSFGKEYRIVFTVSCTFLYYYDLVTSLSPEIQQVYDDANSETGSRKPVNIAVKAGQSIGRIGGQTLDFAVWDTTKPLDGFVVSEHYNAESWKIFTADPLDYYDDELKEFILTRYVRTVPPISGKIDYDIDGRLIGNWFLEGTNGYSGDISAEDGSYWTTHLSFAPNHYAPNWFVVSIGDYVADSNAGPGSQFVTVTNKPNPKDISVETGLVKYDLSSWSYLDGSGAIWDRSSITSDITIKNNSQQSPQTCVLVQMLEARKIKFETFKGQSCLNVAEFSNAAKIYTR
jgi:hypothetical protein